MPLRAPEDSDEKAPVINGNDATIRPICTALAERVNAFLLSEAKTPLLKAVQDQTRIALGVIDTALQRYRYVCLSTFAGQRGNWNCARRFG
jgi:FAD synthetase